MRDNPYTTTKVWSELSEGDRQLAWGIANSHTGKVAEVREILVGRSINS